jgi:glycosyltransferase involved in cell wall biosynthesis
MSSACSASVVISNYNYGRFLPDAIESALAQTYANLEIIVVDDGSTDSSKEVIDRYGKRVVAILKKNGGQASGYNAGFAASRGEYVCFLDADDMLEPTTIAEAVEAFQDSRVVKSEWQLEIIDEIGRPTGGMVPEKPLPAVDLRELTISEGPFYDWLITPPGSGNCYRRAMLDEVLPMPEPPFRHGADVYLTMLAPIFGRVRRLARPRGKYRIHEMNNYFGRNLEDDRLLDYRRRFEDYGGELVKQLRSQGVVASPANWTKSNFNYLWPTRVLQSKADIESVLPRGAAYIIVNENEWGDDQPVGGRHAIPFLECNGNYGGPPADDEVAIAELIRLRRDNDASYLVISWTSYWWLEHYVEFHAWLRSQCRCLLENERLTIFDIRAM